MTGRQVPMEPLEHYQICPEAAASVWALQGAQLQQDKLCSHWVLCSCKHGTPNLSATWGMTWTLETRRRNGSYSGKTIKRAGEQQVTRSQHSQQDPGGLDDLYGSFPTWDNLWLSKLWEVSSAPCSLPGKQWRGVRASHPSRSTKRTASYGDREEELASCAIISSAVWHRKVFSKHSPAEATCSTPSCDAIQHCC